MRKLFFLSLFLMQLFAAKGVLIPFYHYPTLQDSEVEKIIELKKHYPSIPFLIIVNPNNGVFSHEQYNFARMIDLFHAHGIEVLGYVYTKYGARDLTKVHRDIRNWERFYKKWGVEGIFLDEVDCNASKLGYYTKVIQWVRKYFQKVVLNPGAPCLAPLSSLADIVVVNESDTFHRFSGKIETKKARLLYGAKSVEENLSALAQDVDFLYISHLHTPNPWEKVSKHLEKLLQFLSKEKQLQ